MNRPRLFTPGPTEVPEQVLQRMAESILHHRSSEFKDILKRVNKNLQYVFQTEQKVLILACSGTGGVEATFMNLFSPGDKIISVNNGKFGERWVLMPRSFGLDVAEIKLGWGKAPDAEQIVSALKQNPGTKAVYLTHCETSTGAITDIRSIAKAVRETSEALVCVDGISSVGAQEFHFDQWGVDVCVSASQKGFMVPPGLSFVAMSERAKESMSRSRLPKYYFDFSKYIEAYLTDSTPWTPAITLVNGLDEALLMMRDEGLEKIWQRHRIFSATLRTELQKLDLKLFSEFPSDTVTVCWMPDGSDWKSFSKGLKDYYNIVIAGGQGEYTGKIFRIGHIGYFKQNDTKLLIEAINGTARRKF